MRVLMTSDAVGGVWTYATELSAALRERGAEVTLAVLGPMPFEADDVVHVHPGKLEWQDDPWADVREAGERLLDLAHDVQPDVVHLNGYAHGALGFGAPVLVAGHSDVLSWWQQVRGEPAPPAWSTYADAVRAGLRAADSVVTPTAAMLAELGRLYGVGGRVIPNGLDDFGDPFAKEPFVLAAGRLWDPAKGLDALEDAAARLPWPIEVAGDSASPPRGVRALGRLAPGEVRERMRRASVFAHPARYEPFGLAPLEAGLAGCALVLGDIASLREVWGDAATFVPPGDGTALAAAINALIEDPERRAALSARASTRAQEYDAGRMADRYLQEYARIAAGRAVSA